ncbi:MAG: hypothetical protein ACI4TJ_08050 [Candidatus Cryptobacteroides sp.]
MEQKPIYKAPLCEVMELEALSVVCSSNADSINVGDPWSGFEGEEEW